MAKKTIGLDIGNRYIKVVHLEGSEVLRTHEVPYSEEALASLKEAGLLGGDVQVTGLAGADAQVRSLDVPFSNTKKIAAILGGLLDAQLPLEIEDLEVSWFLQTEKTDPQQKISAAFAKKSAIGGLLERLTSVGINPQIITLRAAALYELMKRELTEPATAMIVDIGDESTSWCLGTDKHLLLARSVLKSDAASVLRELRQTLIAFEKPVDKIFLVGSGALTPEIEPELSRVMGVPVTALQPLGLSPTFAIAASYALIGQTRTEKLNRFNLRIGEFAFKSEMKFATERTKTFGIWAAVVLVLLTVNYGARRYFLGSRIDDLRASEAKVCAQVMGDTKSKSCLSAMKKAIAQGKQDAIPDMSATDIYLEIAKDLPTDMKLKVTSLDIGNDGVRMSGDVTDFESVDSVVSALSKGRCFKKVEKGPARQSQSGVSFQVSMDIDCGSAS